MTTASLACRTSRFAIWHSGPTTVRRTASAEALAITTSAIPGFSVRGRRARGEFTDPSRDWTADSKERVNYFSIYIAPPRIGSRTEARLSYDYGYAKGSYDQAIVPGGPLVPPNQLPDVYNKLQQLHIDVRHRLSNRLAATFSYLYEPFRIYDFAFDPSVVNGIVQPSSLVMGYVYRPYTAHSAVFGVKYFW